MKQEIYCGFDTAEFNRIRDALDCTGIKHTHKITDLTMPSCLMDITAGARTAPKSGSAQSAAARQYYVYVDGGDYENAVGILRK